MKSGDTFYLSKDFVLLFRVEALRTVRVIFLQSTLQNGDYYGQ